MIRSSCSSSYSTAHQSSYSQVSGSHAVHMQGIQTSSARRYHQTESSSVSTVRWYQQFSGTSTGCQLAEQTGALTLNEVRIIPNEAVQQVEWVKTDHEDFVLTCQQMDYILHEINTMTEEDVKIAYARFLEICPNGKMTRTMFANVLQDVFSEGNADGYCKYAFKLFDRDNNGTLSFTEFVFAMQIYSSNDLQDSLGLVFDIFDCDRSGTIDKAEIIQMIIATSELTGNLWKIQDAQHLAKKIMKSCDIRRTGKITRTEFINGCENVSEYCQRLVPGYDEDCNHENDHSSDEEDEYTNNEDHSEHETSVNYAVATQNEGGCVGASSYTSWQTYSSYSSSN